MATKDSGTVNIHGKEYKTVAARVQEFREKWGIDGFGILTEIVSADDKVVVMKATIQDMSDRVIATGHAEEVRTSSQINRTSALENAETSAIGRALAAFGLAGTEYASADEVAQAITQQRTPAAKPQPTTPQEHVAEVFDLPPKGTEITDAQLKRMMAHFNEMGISDREERLAYVTAITRRTIESSRELTRGEAVKVIDKQLADIEDKGGEA